ncbi:MAG: hypothetical protein JW734_09225 [Candidatus Omnitrophica bacterium]|nr:hypothetical protein [Candidatus Omnitrophota bacterium]
MVIPKLAWKDERETADFRGISFYARAGNSKAKIQNAKLQFKTQKSGRIAYI